MDAHLDTLASNRLRWKCRRGLLELDLVLQKFRAVMTEGDVKPLLALLDLPDNDLLDIIMGRSERYERRFEATVARLRAA